MMNNDVKKYKPYNEELMIKWMMSDTLYILSKNECIYILRTEENKGVNREKVWKEWCDERLYYEE